MQPPDILDDEGEEDDATAFFIALSNQTIKEIGSFLIIMFVWYMTFGTAFYIINLNRSGDGIIVPDLTPFWFFDAFEN